LKIYFVDLKANIMKISRLINTAIFLLLISQLSFGQGMKVKPGTNVIINTSTTLKVAGGGDLTVLDDQTYSPSLLERGSLAFTGGGALEVQQYIEKNQWHIISSPMTSQTIAPYTDSIFIRMTRLQTHFRICTN
jgi:hypothetical protein